MKKGAKANGQAAEASRRRQSGVRLPEDTIRLVRIYAAENDLTVWEAQDRLLRAGLEATKPKK